MKTKEMRLKISLLVSIIVSLLFTPSLIIYAQGPGCVPGIGPQPISKYEVSQSVNLAPHIMENTSPQVKAEGVFFHNRITITQTIEPGWRVILSSDVNGRKAFCTDDLIRIQASTGRMFEHDFRAADRSRIVPLEPLDVTELFDDGALWLEINMVDLSPQFRSSSAYYLVVINPSPSHTLPSSANIFTPTLPTASPTFTPVPSLYTPSPSPSSTTTTTATATPKPALTIVELTPTPQPVFTFSLPDSPPPPNIILGLILLNIAAGLGLWMVRRPRLTGVLEITKDGEPWKTVDLSTYDRQVTIGSKGRIKLDDHEEEPSIPAIVARLIAERGPDSSIQVVWQHVAEETDEDSAAYRLKHGDEEIIEGYHFVYQNFSEPETIDELFEGDILNEI